MAEKESGGLKDEAPVKKVLVRVIPDKVLDAKITPAQDEGQAGTILMQEKKILDGRLSQAQDDPPITLSQTAKTLTGNIQTAQDEGTPEVKLIEPVKMLLPKLSQMQDEQFRKATVPMDGKLIISTDPTLIGRRNFQTLTNMKYRPNHIKGVGGMTKINADALTTYPVVDSAFQYIEQLPNQSFVSHIMARAWNAPFTASCVQHNNCVIPAQQDWQATPLWTDTTGAGLAKFSAAPDHGMVYCNGIDTMIWGGGEAPVGSFVIYNPNNLSYNLDFTSVVNNPLTDAQNIAMMEITGGGLDAYVSALYHFDNNYTDASGNSETLTGNGTVFSNAAGDFKWGYGLFVSGTAYTSRTITSDVLWDLSGGVWTVDFWIMCTSLSNMQTPFLLLLDTNNDFIINVLTNGSVQANLYTSSTVQTPLQITNPGVVTAGSWYHIEVSKDSSNVWRTFVNGTLQSQNTYAVNLLSTYTTFHIGSGSSNAFYVDEMRISKGICRHTANFTPLGSPYSTTSTCNLRIGATRALSSVKFYVENPNSNSGVILSGTYFNGSTTALTITSDTTITGSGVCLGQTGVVTFSDTSPDAKINIINQNVAYFYSFIWTGLSAGTTVYSCSVYSNMQPITDIWDGTDAEMEQFIAYIGSPSTPNDYTVNVASSRNSYDINDSSTYAVLGGLIGSTNYALCGSALQLMGIVISFIPTAVNTTANTVLTVQYTSDGGSTWVAVNGLSDGTSLNGISFAQNGVISWVPPTLNNEFLSTVAGLTPLYHYRLIFSQTLSGTVEPFYVAGIPAPRKFDVYTFPLMAQDRLFLAHDNKLLYSALETNCTFNGDDSTDITFEEAGILNGGCSLYSQYGSSLYNLILVFSNTKFWVVSGTIPSTSTNLVTDSVGLAAPLTLATVALPADVAPGLNRNVAVWQGANGVYVSDGRSPIPIHYDIWPYFDKTDARCINAATIGSSSGFVDANELTYHWLFFSGASATPIEMVFDFRKWAWYQIDRTTGLRLRTGISVVDSYGNSYAYGFIDTGYMERLENGTTFDGAAITHTIQTADFSFTNILVETRAYKVNLVCVANTVSTATCAYTHYVDTAAVGTSSILLLTNVGYRLANFVDVINSPVGVFHSGQFVVTTNNEICGFEPIALGYSWQYERDHLKDTYVTPSGANLVTEDDRGIVTEIGTQLITEK